MRPVEKTIDRILTCLSDAIRERGYTQLEVQEALGWGRSYISQLVTKQKRLRFEQILKILNVIGVTPKDFYGQVFQFDRSRVFALRRRRPTQPAFQTADASTDVDPRRAQLLYVGIVTVLRRKGLIKRAELDRAIDRARRGEVVLPTDAKPEAS